MKAWVTNKKSYLHAKLALISCKMQHIQDIIVVYLPAPYMVIW